MIQQTEVQVLFRRTGISTGYEEKQRSSDKMKFFKAVQKGLRQFIKMIGRKEEEIGLIQSQLQEAP